MSKYFNYKLHKNSFNEKYTRDISMYMQKFEMFKKVKQELDIEGVTFQPVIMNSNTFHNISKLYLI